VTTEHILVNDSDEGVRCLTLNRPEARNALTQAAKGQLCELLSDSERDPAIRCVIVTGTDPVFSAGVDFKELGSQPSGATWNAHDAQFSINPGRALRAMATPTIAAVNGACVSGALEIALSCSFIVASDQATFADTHARLGAVATWGLTALLPQAVGVRLAREMSITGRFIGAESALNCGMVNHVVPHANLMPFSQELAGNIAPTGAVSELLLLYARGEGLSLAQRLDLEAQYTARRTFKPGEFLRKGSETADRSRTAT
jgi:enoyl-CoA hydratase